MSIQQAVNAPVTIALADGKDYRFAKLSPTHWCEFCEWINRCLEKKPGDLVSPDIMLEWASSVNGMRWLIWRSMRDHHPKVQIREVGDLMGSFGRMAEVLEIIADMPKKEESESDPPEVAGSIGASSAP